MRDIVAEKKQRKDEVEIISAACAQLNTVKRAYEDGAGNPSLIENRCKVTLIESLISLFCLYGDVVVILSISRVIPVPIM